MLITTSHALVSQPDLPSRAEVLDCGDHEVDLPLALTRLHGMGLGRVLTEGGPSLFRSLIESGLVDELCLTLSPLIAGAGPRRLTGGDPLGALVALRLIAVVEGDGLLLTRYGRPG